MQIRKFDELISYFNRNVSNMDIDLKYKMQLLGMITAIGLAHEKEMPHWIPVSERLPERGKEVLVTRDYDGREDHNKSCRYVETASCYGEEDDISWYSYSDEYKMTPGAHRVIAWKPLPKPYTEDKT